MKTALPHSRRPRRAFTLMEIMVAIIIMALLLVAVHAAFLAALRLRDSTVEAVESTQASDDAIQIMQRDLANLVVSTNTNAVFFAPLQNTNPTNPLPGQIGPDFYTSCGELDGMTPWGNVIKVDYLLTAPTNGGIGPGQDLVRTVTHNLLPVNGVPMPDEREVILTGVRSVNFLFYDGSQWDAVWNTTEQTNLPLGIKVQIQMAAPAGAGLAASAPLEIVVPIDTLLTTNPITTLQ